MGVGVYVSFLGVQRAENRLTVSVEIKWRFRLKPGEIYFIHLKFADWGSEEFYDRLQKGGQITVPIEIVEGEALSKGDVMKVHIQVRDDKEQPAMQLSRSCFARNEKGASSSQVSSSRAELALNSRAYELNNIELNKRYVITPGEKIAILMPSVFFIVLIIIKSVSDARLAYELKKKLNIENESVISEVIGPNLYLGYFFDYLILAITNGLSLILVLNQIEIGVIQLLIGIIASILGIVYLDADKDLIAQKMYGKTITERIFAFCYYFTFAQTGYFIFFDIQLFSLNVIFSPWIGFITFFVVAYLFDKGFTSAMRSRMP